MRKVTIALVLLAPAVAAAQSSGSASAQMEASVTVEAKRTPPRPARAQRDTSSDYRAPSRFSAATRTRLEATVAAARERGRYSRPLVSRIHELEAKGATDAQVVAATSRYSAQLNASYDAMVRAGRSRPSEQETVTGASAMARGYTAAQVEGAVRSGASVQQSAIASVETMMATGVAANGAADASASLGRTNVGASAVGGATAGAGSGVAAGAGAAAAASGAIGGVAGSVGAVGGLRRP